MRRASRRTGCSSGDVRGPVQNSQGHVTSSWRSTIKENKSKVKRRERVDLRGKDCSSQRWIFFFSLEETFQSYKAEELRVKQAASWHQDGICQGLGGLQEGKEAHGGSQRGSSKRHYGWTCGGAWVAAGRFASTGLAAGAKLPYCSQGRTAARVVPNKPGLLSSPCGVGKGEINHMSERCRFGVNRQIGQLDHVYICISLFSHSRLYNRLYLYFKTLPIKITWEDTEVDWHLISLCAHFFAMRGLIWFLGS